MLKSQLLLMDISALVDAHNTRFIMFPLMFQIVFLRKEGCCGKDSW